MDVIIQSLGFKHSSELEGYIQKKLEKLKPSDRIIRANVVLFQGPDRNTPEDYCEIRLEVPGPDLFVKEHGLSFEQSVDSCVDVLARQLKKAHEKQVDHTQRNNPNDILTDQLLSSEDDNEEGGSLNAQ
ncbi:HPF/RaiA family ribosome-associated protein [Flaviaesturariibacter flavus]|uniref:HPF/RaiA family ribosome-associated protein n=1 Tax=Flaviaesturariibacter flavus TaxID=2502780 RepID=A0A4R1B6S6_9BACT|nr:HPF/RaiA family ribosome-associated protein [Flaviaesturariibacter flavus]TCJ12028.1 HPF/RaiA family ribosome-associated protein [Flaviaesturariibacter flavus]